MGAQDYGAQQQPWLFMVQGTGQKLDRHAVKSAIARHVSRQYHGPKKRSLLLQSYVPKTIIPYPVAYHHGGQRVALTSTDSNGSKKRKKYQRKPQRSVNRDSSPSSEDCPASNGRSPRKVRKSESSSDQSASEGSEGIVENLQMTTAKDPENALKAAHPKVAIPLSSRVDEGTQLSLSRWQPNLYAALPIQPEGCVPLTVDYFLRQWAPDFDRDYTLAGYQDPHLSIVFPLAMDHPVLMQALIAMCRVFYLKARNETWQDEVEYLKHRGRALALVQNKIDGEDATDDAVLMAVVCLMSIELLASNATGVAAHSSGLRSMLQKRRNRSDEGQTSRYAKASAQAHATIGRYFHRRASKTQSRTTPTAFVTTPTYVSSPPSLEACASFSGLPEGFRELAYAGHLSLECVSAMLAVTNKVKRFSRVRGEDAVRTIGNVDTELKMLYHLHFLPGKTDIEDFLIHGLICFCTQFPDKFKNRNPFFNIALKCFNDGRRANEKILGLGQQPWMVWAIIVVAGALEICATPLSGRHIILDSMLDSSWTAHNWSWVETAMRQFLWTDELGSHWKTCWEDGMQRWEERHRRDSSPSTSSTSEASGVSEITLDEILMSASGLSEAFSQAQPG